MVVIVSGPRDCGKTTWCRENLKPGSTGGVLLVKVFRENVLIGYDAVRMTGGDGVRLMRIRDGSGGAPPDWDPVDEIGRFSISARGLDRAADWIREAAEDASRDVLVDEVGRLELNGRGFSPAVEFVVRRLGVGGERTLYLVVRITFVRDILKLFGIEEAQVLEIEKGTVRSRSTVRT